MTSQAIQASVNQLIELVEQGKTLEAFDKFYHEDFVGQENQSPARIGKAANRQFEVAFLQNIEKIRTYRARSTMVGTNVSAIAWEIDIDHAIWGPTTMTEINLQVWDQGKIIRETYNYKS